MMNKSISRRSLIESLLKAMAVGAALPAIARADGVLPVLNIYKDPSCGCCGKWVEHLTANGLKGTVTDRKDMDAFKDSLGIPAALRSCHTAVYGQYWIEGHVPAAEMKALLEKKPKDVVGLAVPGMPSGSPGMEMGAKKDRYDVLAVRANGKTSVFSSHG